MAFDTAFASVIAAGGLGLLLGLKFRVPALLFATAALLLACVLAGMAWHWPATAVMGWAVALAATMQISYLMGVSLAHGVLRQRHGRTDGGDEA
ncbi:MAG: hypothetical protein KJZ80_02525 [Hyphomicrobiaceae bacterium]|nr:hypothetical protein [Hyphomicrobiaceae bacterium]